MDPELQGTVSEAQPAEARLRRLAVMLPIVVGLAVYSAWHLAAIGWSEPKAWSVIALLSGLAILAEAVPVRIPGTSLQVSFPLPYVAALSVAWCPLGAVIADLTVALLWTPVHLARRHGSGWTVWTAINLSISVLSACAGAYAAMAISAGWPFGSEVAAVHGVTFALTYACVNYLSVTLVDTILSGKSPMRTAWSGISVKLVGILFFALMAATVSVLTVHNLPLMVALTFVPVLAMRAAIILRNHSYEVYYETIATLTTLLQKAHSYTPGHLERVARLAEQVSLELGLPAKRARLVREAALLHDIGKIAVDELILDKPGRLNEQEQEHVRQHAAFGAEILAQVPDFREMVPWIRHHHERPDGKGYPSRLVDVEIPVECKIIAVADAFDAMVGGEHSTERRNYRPPMSPQEAFDELERCSGTQFDRRVVRAFRDVATRGLAS